MKPLCAHHRPKPPAGPILPGAVALPCPVQSLHAGSGHGAPACACPPPLWRHPPHLAATVWVMVSVPVSADASPWGLMLPRAPHSGHTLSPSTGPLSAQQVPRVRLLGGPSSLPVMGEQSTATLQPWPRALPPPPAGLRAPAPLQPLPWCLHPLQVLTMFDLLKKKATFLHLTAMQF